MNILTENEWLEHISSHSHSSRGAFKAMYSTWWNGIVTDPNLMLIPIDDHQVHRGDGVFEAFKAIQGKIYLLDAHLDRMEKSASSVGLKMPMPRQQLKEIIGQTLKASGLADSLLRLFLGRGPGSFSANPYETVGEQLHLIATELTFPSREKIENGVSLALSKIPVKDPFWATIKSCNYLPNVLMKKEAVDLGVDFTVGLTPNGAITESSTENLILLTKDNKLLRPEAHCILAGTTMLRTFELAKTHQLVSDLGEKEMSIQDLFEAKEIIIVGTTLDALSVTRFQDKAVGDGTPGPLGKQLRKLLIEDQL